MTTARVFVVTGHAGSGKSEFSLNLALRFRAELGPDAPCAVADLDVVNPYFRSRERRQLLEAKDIRVVANSLSVDEGVDLPAVSAELHAPLSDPDCTTVIDAGGDPVGARLLHSIRRMIPVPETEVLCVINAMRPATRTIDGALLLIRGIESASGLSVTGLVNNTHLLEETKIEHIEEGDRLCRGLMERTGLPLRFVCALDAIIDRLPERIQGDRLGIAMHLRESWMLSPKEISHGTR